MSLFTASSISPVKRIVSKQSITVAPASEARLFFQMTVIRGDPVYIRRGSTVEREGGLMLVGAGAAFRDDQWKGDISVISDGTTLITGEIGYD